MSYRLGGRNPLAYMGVEPSQPPQMLIETRSPTINDNQYNIGTYWFIAAPPPTDDWELWILADLTAGIATWLQLYPGSSGGIIRLDADMGFAVPILGIVNVFGGPNINTTGDDVQTLHVNLNETIHWPATSSDGLAGAIYLNGSNGSGGSLFMHDYGTDNTWLGINAGNLTLGVGGSASAGNTGIGFEALTGLTNNSSFNTAIGNESLTSLTGTANGNTALGAGSLQLLVGGSDNLCLGIDAGSDYTTTESNNIILANDGVIGESNTIRIGVEGTQTAAYMAGIYDEPIGMPNAIVYVDSTGKLATGSPIPPPPTPGSGGAFLGSLQSNTASGIGASVQYLLGTTVPFTTIFDDSGGYFPGDGLGTPASFTAPTTGKYYLSVQILMYTSPSPRELVQPAIQIITPERTYQTNAPITSGDRSTGGGWAGPAATGAQQWPLEFSCIANLTSGDVVTFGVFFGNGLVSVNQLILYGSTPAVQTFITGYFIY